MYMLNKSNLKYINVMYLGLACHILLNLICNGMGILTSYYYRGVLVAEVFIIIMVLVIFKGKIYVSRNEYFFLFILLFSQLFSYIMTTFWGEYICFDIHRLLLFLVMVLVTYICAKRAYISERDFENFNKIILGTGVVACIYEFFQNISILMTLNLSYIMLYTNKFTSFFSSRSNYCLLLTCCFCLCLYFANETKKKRYYLLAALFTLAILITNARTSAIVILIVFLFNLNAIKNRTKIIIVLLLPFLLIFMPWDRLLINFHEFYNKYYMLFMHAGANDISNGRFDLWLTAFSDVNLVSFFIGHGIGSKDAFLTAIGSVVKSFHSSWVDLFYEMGMVGVCSYFYIMYRIIIKTKKSSLTISQKRLIYNYYIVLVLCGIGDSVALPFLLDTSCILSTIIFITCPICLINGSENVQEGEKDEKSFFV